MEIQVGLVVQLWVHLLAALSLSFLICEVVTAAVVPHGVFGGLKGNPLMSVKQYRGIQCHHNGRGDVWRALSVTDRSPTRASF